MTRHTEQEMDALLSTMTTGEKIELCSGADFWHTKDLSARGIPAATLSDGPSGLRRQPEEGDMLGINESVPATCFPAAVTTAASFDPTVTERVGRAIGEEALAQGVGVVLGPGANIKRSPLCGRSFEYFSEDPLLSGEMAAGWIRGLEATGAQASLKHFACNNQEYERFSSDSLVDERTLREIYLASFERAVRSGHPSTVMSAYNLINGTHCSSNRWLLTHVLRDEWGFDGMVVTDWGGMSERSEGFAAGCDLMMPGGSAYGEAEALAALRAGTLDERDVNASTRRVLHMMTRAQDAVAHAGEADMAEHHRIAVEVAEAGAVLMRNEGGALPLADVALDRIVLIGDMARAPRYQGTGSSHINPWKLITPADAMPEARFVQGCREDGSTSEELLAAAIEAARGAEAAVVFAGLPARDESEGFDRSTLELPEGMNRLVEAVAAVNPRTIVVLMCGGVVEMPWFEQAHAVLYLGLAGQGVGEAVRALLLGQAEPGGRLAETWPLSIADCVCTPYYAGERRDAQYREGVYVGYRYYASAGVEVRLPFGFGLGYTEFAYRDITVERTGSGWKVRATLANVGSRAGSETAQLYVAPPAARGYRPARELRGFSRVRLEPGEEAAVELELEERDFAVWDASCGAWAVPSGTYTLLIGRNCADTPLAATLDLETNTAAPAPPARWYKQPEGTPTQADFEALLGRRVIERVTGKGLYTRDSTVAEMSKTSLIMRLVYKAMEWAIARRCDGKVNYDNPEFRMQMASSAGASISSMRINAMLRAYVFEGMLEMANGHVLRGLRLMMRRVPRISGER